MTRLVVVSNRVSVPKAGKSGAQGGLAVAVHAAFEDSGGLWFGWSGKSTSSNRIAPHIESRNAVDYATVDLTQRDHDEYYNGFANRSIWPLFHYRLDLTDFSRRDLAGYIRTNAFFARHLVPLLKQDDLIWVHDYHFIPLAEQLRRSGCRQPLGFFLHIPWPSSEVFVALPNHRNIVEALLAYDLIGFQTETDLHNFHEYIHREAGGYYNGNGRVCAYGKLARAGVYPIGIDTENIVRFARESVHSRHNERLQQSINGRQLIIGVDRLDYSKGLVQRFEALDYLLSAYPENHRNVIMLQITPPSRVDVPEYEDIRRQLEETASHVNGRYSEYDWIPIRYLNKGFSRQVLSGFFRSSRIGLVTPLRDGMNLVAKEYIAAQDSEDPGILVLSRFAGAARELSEALIVNPYDVEGIGECLQEALNMPLDERRERWSKMYQHLVVNDITAWWRSFLADLSQARADQV